MGSEYFINSQELEDKVRTLLPSQGGAGAGFDLSASTQIIPIIDLTESAEGSNLRQDLQTALSFNNVTSFDVLNTTTTIISNTGYFRIFGGGSLIYSSTGSGGTINITDGVSTKALFDCRYGSSSAGGDNGLITFDFIAFCDAGDSISITTDTRTRFAGSTRQIAAIDGTLV